MDIEKAKEAMNATVSLLSQIEIPMVLFDQVGVPIKNAINNMLIGLDALKEDVKAEVEEVGNDHAE